METLDKCFENVCELDLIFHSDAVHYILNELVMGGMVLQTNMNEILARIDDQTKIQKTEVCVIHLIISFWQITNMFSGNIYTRLVSQRLVHHEPYRLWRISIFHKLRIKFWTCPISCVTLNFDPDQLNHQRSHWTRRACRHLNWTIIKMTADILNSKVIWKNKPVLSKTLNESFTWINYDKRTKTGKWMEKCL